MMASIGELIGTQPDYDARFSGSSTRWTASRRRMRRASHRELGIPAESLIKQEERRKAA